MAVRVAGYNSEQHKSWVNILKHIINKIKAIHKKQKKTSIIAVYLFISIIYLFVLSLER